MSAVNQVIKDMQERPQDFCCDEFWMTDTKTKYTYWIGKGIWHYRIHRPYRLEFSIFEEIKFHSALLRWKNDTAVRLAQKSDAAIKARADKTTVEEKK